MLADKILACYNTGIPCLIWGRPGIGKTASIRHVADKLGANLEVVISSIREPSDFIGLPYRVEGGVKMCPPNWVNTFNENKPGILFFDEIGTCAHNIQAALLGIILDGIVGEVKLPNTVYRIAASNFTDCVGNNELNPALGNRFIHINAEASKDEFVRILKTGFNYELSKVRNNKVIMSEDGESLYIKKLNNFRNEVGNYLSMNNIDTLSAEVPSTIESPLDYAFVSPRSWTNVVEILATLDGGDEELIKELIFGTIGIFQGDKFWTYIKGKLSRVYKFEDHIDDFAETFDLSKLEITDDEVELIIKEYISWEKSHKGNENSLVIAKHIVSELSRDGWTPLLVLYNKKLNDIISFQSDLENIVTQAINNGNIVSTDEVTGEVEVFDPERALNEVLDKMYK